MLFSGGKNNLTKIIILLSFFIDYVEKKNTHVRYSLKNGIIQHYIRNLIQVSQKNSFYELRPVDK